MTAGMTLLGTLTVPGQPSQVQAARRFTRTTIGTRCPCADTAALLVSEVVTNALRYSNSGRPGGTVTITVIATTQRIRIEVIDDGSASVPTLSPPQGELDEGGRGLHLLNGLAAAWGYYRDEAGTVTWFELPAPAGE